MTPFAFVIALALAAPFAWSALRPRTPEQHLRRGTDLARDYRVLIAAGSVPDLDRRLDAQERLGGAVTALCVVVVFPLSQLVPGPYLAALPAQLAVLALAAVVGSVLGEVLVTVRTAPGPRVARSRRVRVGDYVRPSLRVWLLVSATTGLLAAGLAVARDAPTVIVATALAPVLALVVTESSGQLLVRRGQPSTGPGQLYLQDLLRSESLRRCYERASSTSAGIAGVAAVWALPQRYWWTLGVLGLVVFVGSIVLRGRRPGHHVPQLRFRERLWPMLPPEATVSTATGRAVA